MRIPIEADSPETLAKTLRGWAELTSNGTQNWENYEMLVLDILKQIQVHYTKVV